MLWVGAQSPFPHFCPTIFYDNVICNDVYKGIVSSYQYIVLMFSDSLVKIFLDIVEQYHRSQPPALQSVISCQQRGRSLQLLVFIARLSFFHSTAKSGGIVALSQILPFSSLSLSLPLSPTIHTTATPKPTPTPILSSFSFLKEIDNVKSEKREKQLETWL
ncbi:hypothetical protein VNO77_24925 [Canavalia gladiata]|uniref:Uncharacterized protein n=1 Tax=Canavalia gladiata TaxID=3824 RepID=A0AAN9L9Q2_CANGL